MTTKILLIITAFPILAFIAFALYRTLVVTNSSDKQESTRNNDKTDVSKQICPRCKIGKCTYELDPKSEMCPNICCLKDGKCKFNVPL